MPRATASDTTRRLCVAALVLQLVNTHNASGRTLSCCDDATLACTACRAGTTPTAFCELHPETHTCRHPAAQACSAASTCPTAHHCVLGICVPNPSCLHPMQPEAWKRFCAPNATKPLSHSPPCAAGLHQTGPAQCLPSCCALPMVAVCQACLAGASTADACMSAPQMASCGTESSCTASGGVGSLATTCATGRDGGNDGCSERTLQACKGPVCGRIRDTGGWRCEAISPACGDCREAGSACAVVGSELTCVPRSQQPHTFCPLQRRCQGADAENIASHFCCGEEEVCDVQVLYGGPRAAFGGRCIPAASYDPGRFFPCLFTTQLAVSDGKPTCGLHAPFRGPRRFHLPPAPLCGIEERQVITGGVSSCVRTTPVYATPCGAGSCPAGQVCRMQVVRGSLVQECRPTADDPDVACNQLRADYFLPVCNFGCQKVPLGTLCLPGPRFTKNLCAGLVWPPTDEAICGSHSDCAAGRFCTKVIPQPLCNGTTGVVTTWLETGVRACEAPRYPCENKANGWSKEEARYCCADRQIGCDVHNCFDGDTDAWPMKKRTFCCTNTGLGCSMDVDCLTDYLSWSPKKAHDCCREKGICPRGRPHRHDVPKCPDAKGCRIDYCMPSSLPWGPAKSVWCCTHAKVGCPATADSLDCDAPGLSAASTARCCVEQGKHCTHDCATGATNTTAWPDRKRAYCCDTFGVACAKGYSVLECRGSMLDPATQQRCCQLHRIGCIHDCRDPHVWLDPHFPLEVKQYCCETSGVACQPADLPTNRTFASGRRISLVVQGSWLKVVASPRTFVERFRASAASCSDGLAGHVSQVRVSCVSRNTLGKKCLPGTDVVVQPDWDHRFEEAWPGSLGQRLAQQASGSSAPEWDTPSYTWGQPLRVDVDVTNKYAEALVACVTRRAGRVLSTKMGTAAPIVLAKPTADISTPVTSLRMLIVPDEPVTDAPVTRAPDLRVDAKKRGKRGNKPHLFLGIGIAFGAVVGCLCTLAAAFLLKKRRASNQYGYHNAAQYGVTIDQFRALEMALKANQAEGEELHPITQDQMGWAGVEELEERREVMEGSVGVLSAQSDSCGAASQVQPQRHLNLAVLQTLQQELHVPLESHPVR